MQLSTEQMKSIKYTGVSVDIEKSKERIKADFSAATPKQKRAVTEASGQAMGTIYRMYKTGNPNARIVLALADVLNVSPFYYTGETDEKAPCNVKLVKKFLKQQGYQHIADELGSKSADKKKHKSTLDTETQAAETNTEKPSPDAKKSSIPKYESMTDEEYKKAVANDFPLLEITWEDETVNQLDHYDLTEDEAVSLLRALFIRSKVGGSAAEDLETVKRRLLFS